MAPRSRTGPGSVDEDGGIWPRDSENLPSQFGSCRPERDGDPARETWTGLRSDDCTLLGRSTSGERCSKPASGRLETRRSRGGRTPSPDPAGFPQSSPQLSSLGSSDTESPAQGGRRLVAGARGATAVLGVEARACVRGPQEGAHCPSRRPATTFAPWVGLREFRSQRRSPPTRLRAMIDQPRFWLTWRSPPTTACLIVRGPD